MPCRSARSFWLYSARPRRLHSSAGCGPAAAQTTVGRAAHRGILKLDAPRRQLRGDRLSGLQRKRWRNARIQPAGDTCRPPSAVSGVADPLPGMPVVDDAANIYNHDGANMLSPVVAGFPNLVYVPNSNSNTVDVINPSTGAIVEHFAVPAQPQHVVPSYDLKTLWVNSDIGNALTPINPATGLPGKPITGRRPLQPLLHPGRQVRAGDGGAAAPHRLARPDTRWR